MLQITQNTYELLLQSVIITSMACSNICTSASVEGGRSGTILDLLLGGKDDKHISITQTLINT